MPVITDITQQKKRTQFYNVFVDGAFFCSFSDLQLSNLGLRIGQEIDPERLEELKSSSDFSRLYNQALHYLSYRPRSRYEVQIYLQKKTEDEDSIEAVLEKLQADKYINNEEFARSWVENRNLLKPRSTRQLQAELRQKHIPSDIIDSILNEQEDDQQLENIKKLINKKGPHYADTQKLTNYLVGKGFDYSDVRRALEELNYEMSQSEQ